MRHSHTLLAAALVVLAACDSPTATSASSAIASTPNFNSTSQSQGTVQSKSAFSFEVYNDCTGERIQFSGKNHYAIRTATDVNGHRVTQYSANIADMKGIGGTYQPQEDGSQLFVPNGSRYVAAQTMHIDFDMQYIAQPFQILDQTLNRHITFQAVSKGKGDNLLIHILYTTTYDAINGWQTTVKQSGGVCRG